MGAEGPLPGDPRPPAVRRRGARAVRQRARAARSDRRARSCSTAQRRLRLLAGRERRRRHRGLRAIASGTRRAGALQHAAAAGSDRRRQAEPVARRFRRRPRGARSHRLSRRVRRHRRPRRRRSRRAASSATTTTTTRSSSRRSPIGSPKRSRPTCTRARATEWGIDETAVAPTTSSPSAIAASARLRLSRRVRTTARSSSCSSCSRRGRVGIDAHRARGDDAGGERQRPVLRAPARRATSPSAGSARIRSPSYARRKGQSIDEVERWLTLALAYEPARC